MRFEKFEFKKIDFNSIRLEPQYITKYGKNYHLLYNSHKNITREEHYKKYKKTQSKKDQEEYAYYENISKDLSVGLWKSNNSIAPWDWRRGKR